MESYNLVVGDSLYNIPRCLVARDYGETYTITEAVWKEMVDTSNHREFSAMSVVRRWRPTALAHRLIVIGLPSNPNSSSKTRWVWCLRVKLEVSPRANNTTRSLLSEQLTHLLWPLRAEEAISVWGDFAQHSVMQTSSLVVEYLPTALPIRWGDEKLCRRMTSFSTPNPSCPLQCLCVAVSIGMLQAATNFKDDRVVRDTVRRRRNKHASTTYNLIEVLPMDVLNLILKLCVGSSRKQWTTLRAVSVCFRVVAQHLAVEWTKHTIHLGRLTAFGTCVADAIRFRDHVIPSGIDPMCLLDNIVPLVLPQTLQPSVADSTILLVYMRLLAGRGDQDYPPPSPYVRMYQQLGTPNFHKHSTRKQSLVRIRILMRVPRELVQRQYELGWSVVLNAR